MGSAEQTFNEDLSYVNLSNLGLFGELQEVGSMLPISEAPPLSLLRTIPNKKQLQDLFAEEMRNDHTSLGWTQRYFGHPGSAYSQSSLTAREWLLEIRTRVNELFIFTNLKGFLRCNYVWRVKHYIQILHREIIKILITVNQNVSDQEELGLDLMYLEREAYEYPCASPANTLLRVLRIVNYIDHGLSTPIEGTTVEIGSKPLLKHFDVYKWSETAEDVFAAGLPRMPRTTTFQDLEWMLKRDMYDNFFDWFGQEVYMDLVHPEDHQGIFFEGSAFCKRMLNMFETNEYF